MESTINNSHHRANEESNRKKVNFADDKDLPLYYIIEDYYSSEGEDDSMFCYKFFHYKRRGFKKT